MTSQKNTNSKYKTMNQLFYSYKIYDDKILLPKDEAHHCLRVLRKQSGDTIMVVDGKGNYYKTLIETEDLHDCQLKIIDCREKFGYKNHYIHIAMAPPKNHSRVEWFVEKAVEIGIQEISFILTENSERRNIKIRRIQKRAISSMKQSLKAYLPAINEMVSMIGFLTNCTNKERYIGHLDTTNKNLLFHKAIPKSNYCVLIGPEGGYSSDEIKEAQKYEFQSISLGDSRLRTETASIAACHILNIINEE
jgi:16S rRNA (uracil1498-N3)-methyltransferase